MLTRDELAKLSRSLVVQDSSGRDDLLLAIEQAAQAAELAESLRLCETSLDCATRERNDLDLTCHRLRGLFFAAVDPQKANALLEDKHRILVRQKEDAETREKAAEADCRRFRAALEAHEEVKGKLAAEAAGLREALIALRTACNDEAHTYFIPDPIMAAAYLATASPSPLVAAYEKTMLAMRHFLKEPALDLPEGRKMWAQVWHLHVRDVRSAFSAAQKPEGSK